MYSYLRSRIYNVNTQPFGMKLYLDMAMGCVRRARTNTACVFITCIMCTMVFCKYNVTK